MPDAAGDGAAAARQRAEGMGARRLLLPVGRKVSALQAHNLACKSMGC